MGPREPSEGSSKLMGIIRSRKLAKMGRSSPKREISKWDWCKGQQTLKVKDMVIRPGKFERFSKSPWEFKNEMGQGCLKERIKWAEETQDDMRTDPIEILGNVN